MTGRSIREEHTDPSYPLVKAIKKRRMVWLGKVLRDRQEGSLIRGAVLEIARRCLAGEQSAVGTLVDGAPQHGSIGELVEIAEDKASWDLMCNNIYNSKCSRESKAKQYLQQKMVQRAPVIHNTHSMQLRTRKPVSYK